MKQENENLCLETAVPVAFSTRNQLRSIHGISPTQIVYGKTSAEAGLMDEPLGHRVNHPLDRCLYLSL